jgi:hypothetical protein
LVLSCIALYNNPEESLARHQLIKQKEEKVKKNNQEVEKQKRSLVAYKPTSGQYIEKMKKIKTLEDENKILNDHISGLKEFEKELQNNPYFRAFIEKAGKMPQGNEESNRYFLTSNAGLYIVGALGLSSILYVGYRWYKNKKQKKQETLARLKEKQQNNASVKTQ